MLQTVIAVTLITLAIVTPVVTLALCKASKKGDEMLEYSERIMIRGD